MIEARNLSKGFGARKVVDNVSFQAEKGETLILLGTSGSGKTTTLKLLNRIIEPDSGEVFIDSQPAHSFPAPLLRRGIGYVLQDTGLFPHYTIGENIAVVPKLLGWTQEKIKSRTLELLGHFGLSESYYTAYPSALSGGQKQRVGFVRALIASPPIILMDEPFGALDPVTRQSARNDFKSLPELKDKCIIMVTHDIQEAFQLGDRIIIMDEGRIQQMGTRNELVSNPANAFVRNFLKNQYLFLQLEIRKLKQFYSGFLIHPPEGILIGEIRDDESLEKAFETFSPDQSTEVLGVRNDEGEIRFTTARRLMELLAGDMP